MLPGLFRQGRILNVATRMKSVENSSPILLPQPGILAGVPCPWTVCGRAQVSHTADTVLIRNGFLLSSDTHANAEIAIRCRAPKEAPEVQVWAGFRARDRHSRYVVALRGGNNSHLYLARYAPDGGFRFLGIAPLDFSPQPGTWYSLRIVLQDRQIQIYLGDEAIPRLSIEDDANGWTEGGIVLGGGYLTAEFSSVTVRQLSSENLTASPREPSVATAIRPAITRHAVYSPVRIDTLPDTRAEISLDGTWLFKPQAAHAPSPTGLDLDDSDWHTMDVPHFWTPMLAWQHGETMFNELDGVSASRGINDRLWLSEMARVEGYGFDWQKTQTAWYRHHLVLPDDLLGRRFELCFDAIAKACEIWVNGQLAGTHIGMFGDIRLDITSLVFPGRNLIAVKVIRTPDDLSSKDGRIVGIAESVEVTTEMTNSLPRDMFNFAPAGIWQPVKLVITRAVCVHGVFVQPSLDTARVDVEISAQPQASQEALTVSYTVRSEETGEVLVACPGAAQGSPAEISTLTLQLPKVTALPWHPDAPHLYVLELELFQSGERIDRHCTTFGFRTFEVNGNRFLLNGKPYWLRGANHFPHGLRPNDPVLARRFIALAREGNVRITRTHVAPLTETWAAETDRQGMLVSFEGIWPWLMLHGDLPDQRLLQIWHDDFAALVRKYRNHPSVVLWTVNNEMKFYIFDKENKERLQRKWEVVTRMIQTIRRLDPTRPVVADSGYVRKRHQEDYEGIVAPQHLDDGDVDDIHQYYSWYHPSFTTTYRGEFAKGLASPDRPCITQELASGYPRNDDGLPVRGYLFNHATPQALVGDYAFEHNDPWYFLDRVAFITKETGEAIRRTNRNEAAGALHFAYISWFKNVHDAASIKPWAPYHALKATLQPTLVSAELFGRHFFCGQAIAHHVYLINDATDAEPVPAGELHWQVIDGNGVALSEGCVPTPTVPYYSNHQLTVDFVMPEDAVGRCEATLRLRWIARGKAVSENDYTILVASRAWAAAPVAQSEPAPLALYDPEEIYGDLSDAVNVKAVHELANITPSTTPCLAVAGTGNPLRQALASLRHYVEKGGRLLLLNVGDLLPEMLPGTVKSYRRVHGEIVNFQLPEAPVFDGLETQDLAWFHSGPRQPALVCEGVFRVDRSKPGVTVFAEFCDYHNYLQQPQDVVEYTGTPLFECRLGHGVLVAGEINPAAIGNDPVAARLLSNMLAYLRQSTSPASRLQKQSVLAVPQ